MRLLWIATKSPAPPHDGGRLVALTTLEALSAAGVEVTLVAPVPIGEATARIKAELAPICRPRLVPVRLRRAWRPLSRSLLGGPPYSIARHTRPEIAAAVSDLLAGEAFDAVHIEQVQALTQAEPAFRAGVPVVLRAQNVESDVWLAAARLQPGTGPWFAREARRLARFEGAAVRRAAATVALSGRDADRLRQLAGPGARVAAVAPPFSAELPRADLPLAGRPPVVLLGSGGWLPNRDATRWFAREVWPDVRRRLPGAVLHLYLPPADLPSRVPDGVVAHAPPDDSREAFPAGSILVVPLRIAFGVRMKILEAWARGVPVVATPAAVAGLAAEPGRELLVAEDGAGFAEALHRLATEPAVVERLIAAGRAALAGHDPRLVAQELLATYEAAAGAGGRAG